MKTRLTLAVSAAALLAAPAANAQTEIVWWHAMGGALGERLGEIAQGFNDSQDAYVIRPEFQGSYAETLTAAQAAFRAGEQPHILQVFEVGTATMMAAADAIYPVHELMADTGQSFDPDAYLATVTGYYTTPDGEMLSLPFNSSTPVLYYNRDMLAEAGLVNPPTTWAEVEMVSERLIEEGLAECGFTTGWQSWVHIENFSAWHDVSIGTLSNGFEGTATEFNFNSPLHVAHISAMRDWIDSGVFRYGGRRSSGNELFTGGVCAMLTNSSASYAGIRDTAEFDFGVTPLPYWPEVAAAPQNTIIGGASLWVLRGHEDEEYAGVAAFFDYLSSPGVQASWHQETGYLPITAAAYELTEDQGFYAEYPGTETALLQMTGNPPTGNSRGLRFGNFVQIRDVINEELEAAWSGDKTPEEALNDAVIRGNELLRQFEADNS